MKKIFFFFIGLLFVFPNISTAQNTQPARPLYFPNELYLKVRDSSNLQIPLQIQSSFTATNNVTLTALHLLFSQYQVTEITKPFAYLNTPVFDRTYRITIQDTAHLGNFIADLKSLTSIEYAEKRAYRYEDGVPNDPVLSPQGTNNYHLYNTNTIGTSTSTAFDLITANPPPIGTPKSIVAVVDDAVYTNHSDLTGNLWNGNLTHGHDAFYNTVDPNPPYIIAPAYVSAFEFSHGTHVAGIVAAVANNSIGSAGSGLNQVEVMAVKCRNNSDSYHRQNNYEDGIAWAALNGANIINCSWGGSAFITTEYNIVVYAYNKGSIIVASSGGGTPTNPNFPAAYGNGYGGEPINNKLVVAVAELDENDNNVGGGYGDWVDVSAYGKDIYSTVCERLGSYPNFSFTSGYANYTGSSMATPYVSGLLGLMKWYNPAATRDELLSCLFGGASQGIYGPAHPTNVGGQLGYGRVDAYASLQCIKPTCPNFVVGISADDFSLNPQNGQVNITASTPQSNPPSTPTFVWNTGSTAPTITVTTFGTYTVTVTSGGCTATGSYTVRGLEEPAWDCIQGVNLNTIPLILAGSVVAKPNLDDVFATSTVTSQTIYVVGTLHAASMNNYTFTNCTFIFAAGAQFIHESGTVTFDHTTLFSCSKMWKGILVKGDAILNVQQQSIIENAEYGVSLAGGAVQVFISNTTFNRNGIGINYHGGLQPFTGVSVLQQLENCTFDCTAALIPPYLGQIDYHDWSYCGLFLEKTPDISLITPNIFKNMNNGIVASLLNLNIENNTFTNITAHAGFNYEHDGSAMVMKGLDKTPYPVSFRQRGFGGGFNSPNSIEDCDRAFYLVETTCNIQSNTIIGKRGIYAFLGKLSEEKDNQGPLLPTFVIKDNYIRSVEACIELDNCRGASISNNLLAFYGSGTPNQSTQAVLSIVSAYQNPDAQYGIRNNVIANSYGYGIVLNGIKDVAVTDNNLLLTPSTQQVGLTRSSILLSNTREAQISCNKIEINGAVSSTASTTNIYPCGVSIENAVGNTLSCNTFNGVQNGILVSGGCTGGRGLETKIQHNEFASTTPVGTGIWIRGGATLDNQFSATENYGNEWQTPQGTASYTVAGARHDGQRIGISFTGQFKAAQGTKYYPPSFLVSANTPPTSGDGWFSDRSSFAISQCPILPSGFCATNPLAFTNVDIDADIAIAEGIEYASELTDEVYKWDARTLYEKLKEDPSLVFNDAILETFRDSLDATFWEDLYQIAKKQKEADFANKAGDEVLHDQKIAAALQQNASLSSSELCVQNEKYTNEIYLRSFAKGIDIKQIAGIANPADVLPTLTSIAQQCPVIGGPAVYHARAMLYHYQPTVYDDHALCAQQGAVFRTAKPKDKDGSKNGGNKFSISPNPASNFVILKANQPLIEDTVISIFDTFGRIVQVQYLINGSDKWSISTNSLMSGVYYIKIANTVQKIIISH